MKFDKLNDLDTFRWKLTKGAELEGKYDMPKLKPVHNIEPHNLVPFHLTKTIRKPEKYWFHFYEDDYQFERVWNYPSRYHSILRRFEGGISTDYSMYLDMPRSQQIWNCWRNRVIAYDMQQNGILTVPNAGWSDNESLD